jgi:Kef-type K+ transport system membrane component KefB
LAIAGVLADAINLPGIVGAFLAGLATFRRKMSVMAFRHMYPVTAKPPPG